MCLLLCRGGETSREPLSVVLSPNPEVVPSRRTRGVESLSSEVPVLDSDCDSTREVADGHDRRSGSDRERSPHRGFWDPSWTEGTNRPFTSTIDGRPEGPHRTPVYTISHLYLCCPSRNTGCRDMDVRTSGLQKHLPSSSPGLLWSTRHRRVRGTGSALS